MNVGIVTTWFERGAAYVSRQYLEALRSDSNNSVYIYARGGDHMLVISQNGIVILLLGEK